MIIISFFFVLNLEKMKREKSAHTLALMRCLYWCKRSKYCTWEWENDEKNQHEIEFNTIFLAIICLKSLIELEFILWCFQRRGSAARDLHPYSLFFNCLLHRLLALFLRFVLKKFSIHHMHVVARIIIVNEERKNTHNNGIELNISSGGGGNGSSRSKIAASQQRWWLETWNAPKIVLIVDGVFKWLRMSVCFLPNKTNTWKERERERELGFCMNLEILRTVSTGWPHLMICTFHWDWIW